MLLLLKFSHFSPSSFTSFSSNYFYIFQRKPSNKNPSEHRKIIELLDRKLILFQPSQEAVCSKGWKILWENGAQSFSVSSKLVGLFVFSCFLKMLCFIRLLCFCPCLCLLFPTNDFSRKIFVGKAVFENIDLAFGFEPYGSQVLLCSHVNSWLLLYHICFRKQHLIYDQWKCTFLLFFLLRPEKTKIVFSGYFFLSNFCSYVVFHAVDSYLIATAFLVTFFCHHV